MARFLVARFIPIMLILAIIAFIPRDAAWAINHVVAGLGTMSQNLHLHLH